ncbi:hypothetical protein Scep_020594 [Stephania cephalantha]|uniref:50S ribosomal protein L31 n=1 Tax=Stephania cephalantha TaxID=152367 RepID=A0AAP0ID26_9MAGN
MALTLANTFLQTKPPSPKLMVDKSIGGAPSKKRPQWSCRKKEIHPEFYEEAKVYCNGELVLTTGGTQKEYSVDVWSGNHPFYQGSRSALLVDADQVEKFRKKFGELGRIMEIPVLKGEIVLPPKRKSPAKGKKK